MCCGLFRVFGCGKPTAVHAMPPRPATRFGVVTGDNVRMVDGKEGWTFTRPYLKKRLYGGVTTRWRAAQADKCHALSVCMGSLALLIFVIGSTYTLGRTLVFQHTYDTDMDAAREVLASYLPADVPVTVDTLVDVAFQPNNTVAQAALASAGYRGTPVVSTLTDTRVLWASIVLVAAGDAITSNEIIMVFSAIFVVFVVLCTVARFVASRNDKTIANRIMKAYGRLSGIVETRVHNGEGGLETFDIDADDYLRMAEAGLGWVVMFCGLALTESRPQMGLPVSAVGSVLTWHGTVGALETITAVNKDAYQYVYSVLQALEKQLLGSNGAAETKGEGGSGVEAALTPAECAQVRRQMDSVEAELHEVEMLFLRTLHMVSV